MQKELLSTLLTLLTNYVFYVTTDLEYREMVIDASIRFGKSIMKDLFTDGNKYPLQEEFSWSIEDIAINRGYQFESHEITTEDGYILVAFRIPGKLHEKQIANKQPVFLQHGLLDHGGTWFYLQPEMSLAFQLVEDGYDVWVGNNRGTINSLRHHYYSVADDEFWDFTVHELAKYDVPANIDYILDVTGQQQVIYIGHSQGTAQWFIGNILDQNLGSKIKAFIGLAPVIEAGNVKNFFSETAKYTDLLQLVKLFKSTLIVPEEMNYPMQLLIRAFPNTVWTYVETITGYNDAPHIDLGRLQMMAKCDVGGTSSKNMEHWLQMHTENKVQQFDYGEETNLEIYGQPNPPQYELHLLKQHVNKVKILLFTGDKDELIPLQNLQRLLDLLPEHTQHIRVEDYNHVDYTWAKDANFYVYLEIRNFIKNL